MPRRTAPRCSRVRIPDGQLDELVETNLCHGDCFGHWDLLRRVDFERPWKIWGEEITRRWVEAFPGSRPFALYVLGAISPPTWRHDLPGLVRPFRRLEGETVAIEDTGWHKLQPELEHLDALGIVDDDEYDRAVERLEGADATYHGRYRPLARP